jgi:hypothetical protein
MELFPDRTKPVALLSELATQRKLTAFAAAHDLVAERGVRDLRKTVAFMPNVPLADRSRS